MSSTPPAANVGGMTNREANAFDDEWQRPSPSARGYRLDWVLAAALAIGAALSALLYGSAGFYSEQASWWVAALCIIAATAPLAFRRRWPEAVAVVVSLAFVATFLLNVPEILFANIELFIAIYSVGAWSKHRLRARIVRIVIITGMFAWLFISFTTQGSMANSFFDMEQTGPVSPVVAVGLIQVLTNGLYFWGAYYFGERAWTAARQRAELQLRTDELAAEREHSSAQAVALERLRIARELHDVVAHHVSVMGVQAGAARRLMDKDPSRAAESLGAIESSARDAVDELHQLLTTLRDDDDPQLERSEAPSTRGLDQLDALVSDAATSGLAIEFTVVGERRDIPPTIGLSLYRVAQEAITNTIKHAGPGATADVRLRYLPAAIELEVTDTGIGGRVSQGGARLGHVGMRERMTAVGGSVEFGRRDRGGYRVRAVVPTPAGVST